MCSAAKTVVILQKTLHGVFTRKNTCARKWGLTRGEDICSKGAYFRGLMVFESFLMAGLCLNCETLSALKNHKKLYLQE